MYRNAYQRGMLTIFFSVGSKPLAIWDVQNKDGYVSRFLDQDIKSLVVEIGGTNVSTTYITCPKGDTVLGITMPFLVMIVKNLNKYFSFEVTILDETLTRRRFRVSNFQSTTQILPLCTVMPIGLSDGWNQIQFNLAEFTRRAYKKQFVEVQKLKINANIRLRRIYFTEKLIPEDQLPPEYKLYFPLSSKSMKDKKQEITEKDNIKPSISKHKESTADVVRTEHKSSVHFIKKAPSYVSKNLSTSNTKSVPEGEAIADKDVPHTTEIDTENIETVEGEQSAAMEDNAAGEENAGVEENTAAKENATAEDNAVTEENAAEVDKGVPNVANEITEPEMQEDGI